MLSTLCWKDGCRVQMKGPDISMQGKIILLIGLSVVTESTVSPVFADSGLRPVA